MNKRFFLNKKHGVAFMHVAHQPDGRYHDVTCQIGDCDRRVNIDLSFGNKRSQKEKLVKLGNMIDALSELHESMASAEIKPSRHTDD